MGGFADAEPATFEQSFYRGNGTAVVTRDRPRSSVRSLTR